MSRSRAGYIGFNRVSTTTAASGIWTVREAEALRRAGEWPRGPVAPTSLTASAGNAQLTLSWTAPATTYGTVTNYLVEYTPSGGSAVTVLTGSTSTSYTLTGLTNGTSYTARVAAVTFTAGDWSGTATGTPVATQTSVVNGTYNLRVNPPDYEESGSFFVGKFEDGYLGNHVWRTTWSPATKPSAIASATLAFNTSQAASGLQIVVRGANADNAPENSDGAYDAASSSTGKTGSVTVAAPASTATPLSIDVTAIVSAIVARSGWTPGNSLKIYLFGDNATNGTSWRPNPVSGQGIGTLTIQWS